jgi:hypothetical protein
MHVSLTPLTSLTSLTPKKDKNKSIVSPVFILHFPQLAVTLHWILDFKDYGKESIIDDTRRMGYRKAWGRRRHLQHAHPVS